MAKYLSSPIISGTAESRRRELQEAFGKHLIEARNRMAKTVLDRLAGVQAHPLPIVDRMLAPLRELTSSERVALRAAVLDGADQIITGLLTIFAEGNETKVANGLSVANYAIIAEVRRVGEDLVEEQVDINRGEPLLVVFSEYKKWLNRYCPSELRATTNLPID